MMKIILGVLLLCASAHAETMPTITLGGTLGVANGGTGLTAVGTSGYYLQSTGTGYIFSLPSGTVNLGSSLSAANPRITGDVTSGLYTPTGSTVSIITAGTERVRVGSTGLIGLGTTAPTQAISLDGTAAKTIWQERTLGGLAGTNLTVQAAGATVGSTNLNGGTLTLSGGIATGTGKSQVNLNIYPGTATGTADSASATGFSVVAAGTSAINGYRVSMTSTGQGPIMSSFSGTDTNVTAKYSSQGTNAVNIYQNSGNTLLASFGTTLVTFNDMVGSAGTKFTTTGCGVSATTGGGQAGTYTSGTTGTCTTVITINGATGATATNGWACSASDRTTPADLITQTASTTTTATLAGTTATGDVISFSCIGY